jgi:SAM-dependent methyltransferase
MLRDLPVAALKYLPHEPDHNSWLLPPAPDPSVRRDEGGLPIPPDDLLSGYAESADNYLESGGLHAGILHKLLAASGFSWRAGLRVLDFGCGIGRMIRHFRREAADGEVWGVDISATHIHWCQQHLSPPFRFAVTTTIPHLPFPDRYFDVVYAGSVFTHLEDLADAWLLEVRRVLAADGRAYVTIHDDATLENFATGPYRGHWLGRLVHNDAGYQRSHGRFGMLVINRDTAAQVFYSSEFFRHKAGSMFEVLAAVPGGHGYQTAYVLRPR